MDIDPAAVLGVGGGYLARLRVPGDAAKRRIRCKIRDYLPVVNRYYGAGRKNRSYRD
jgi:hypothetical protein